jgi:hypothetical protein
MRERDMLIRLAGLDFVPQLHEYLRVWEHHYLVQDYIEGEQLEQAFVRRCPLVRPQPGNGEFADYATWALDVIAQLEEMLARLHQRGVAFGDLHPANVIIRPDGRCALVDFEACFDLGAELAPELGAPGFVSPAARQGQAVDDYALAAVRMYLLFMPGNLMLHLDSAKADEAAHFIERRYPVSPGFAQQVSGALHAAAGGRLPRGATEDPTASPPPAWPDAPAADRAAWRGAMDSLAAGILATATPERRDRLFPGDVEQFGPGRPGLGLAYGAAGVLYALHACGYAVPGEYLDWLGHAALTVNDVTVGLYDGLLGIAWVLHRTGRAGHADAVVDRALHALDTRDSCDSGRDLTLFSGQAGIAVGLLCLADDTASQVLARRAERIARSLATVAPGTACGPGRRGLMHGPTGLAHLYHRLHQRTGDPAWLQAAERALLTELDSAVLHHGMLHLPDELSSRLVPYLDMGGIGTGLVAAEHPDARQSPRLRDAIEAANRCCLPELVLAPGLFEGRASMILYLALREAAAGDELSGCADRHLRLLSWHAVGYQGHHAFPGRRLHRLSTDLATGSAGVLLAVHAATHGPLPLPGIPSFPRQQGHGNR